MQKPIALFDQSQFLTEEENSNVLNYLKTIEIDGAEREYNIVKQFLISYAGSADTYTAYRRDVERLLQWSWLVLKSPITNINRHNIISYLQFIQNPPSSWIMCQTYPRFINQEGKRIANKKWRPFLIRLRKIDKQTGKKPDPKVYKSSPASMQASIAGISTLFTYLLQEGIVQSNPVQQIRQKSRFIQKKQQNRVMRKLNHLQWQYILNTVNSQVEQDPIYERHLFIISAFYLLGLRISELAETPGRIPSMGDFFPDKASRWWFSTVGKGNKIREVAVPNEMLAGLRRYRKYLGLTALPSRGELTPLIPSLRKTGGIGIRQLRNIVQECFDMAVNELRQKSHIDAAEDLQSATVHWLRHTAISMDVTHRPREHVRDDAGHENISITDRYIEIDLEARHASASSKTMYTHTTNEEDT